jgi:exopolysaccharide production protein ExoQ
MPPILALAIWFVLLVALFCFDPARDKKESWALWVPLIWMFFLSSRDPSQWLSGPLTGNEAYELLEGNPLDRFIFSSLIAFALMLLLVRSFRWGQFFLRNLALMAFLIYCLLSALWSDFPFVTLKHWIRDLSAYLMVLVIMTDPRPLEAARTVLRRWSYLIIPLSILLIKYFPWLGRQYGEWSGLTYFVGACTSKNMLGAACLVSGLFFFWDTASRWPERKQRRTRLILLINFTFIMMTLWLMHMAQSTTSTVCLGLGTLVIFTSQLQLFKWRPVLFKVLPPAAFAVYLILTFALDMRSELANAVGKDATLTDRTKIWAFLLHMHTNPAIGVGYQSFWLGSRLETFWHQAGFGRLNEAHNGYLEVYLELGLIGVFLIGLFLLSSYRSACRSLSTNRPLGVLGCAAWLVIVFYNVSEAALEGGTLFMLLLIGTITVPRRIRERAVQTISSRKSVPQQRSLVIESNSAQTTQWFRRQSRQR